jgi:DNA-binding transcriptional ArsR family regulator
MSDITTGVRDGHSVTSLSPELLAQAAAVFGLFSSTMRLHIIWILAQGECDVGSLASRTGSNVPAVSQSLAKLRQGGLVQARRDGRRQVYLLSDPQLAAAVSLMADRVAAAGTTS